MKNIIEAAQKIIREIGEKKLEEKTKNEYLKILKKITKDPDNFLYAGSKRYYYKKKAALRYCIRQYILWYVKKIESNSHDEEYIKKLVGKLQFLIKLYLEHARNTGVSSVKTKNPGKSKKKSLRRMPKHWREMVWAECENPDYKGAVALLDLVGARPCEIEKGVLVEWEEESSCLTITIKGGKVGAEGKNGQKIRKIKIDISTGCYRGSPKNYLLDCCFEERFCNIKANPKRLNDYVRRISQKLWPRKKNHITPYSYRHQKSADLKKEGYSKEMIAMILGHRSTGSQKHYGIARQGARGSSIIGVECSDPVRVCKSQYSKSTHNIQKNSYNLSNCQQGIAT